MRVLNDREPKTETTQLDFFAVVAHSLFCAIGITTVVFGPLALLFSYSRLSEPWPKVSALAGAVLALFLFQASPVAVVIVFAFSLFVADSAWRGMAFPRMLMGSVALALLLAAGSLAVSAELQHSTVPAFWYTLVDNIVTQIESARKAFSIDQGSDLEAMKNFLRYEGPFLYLSGMVTSFWLSLGMAAHFGWFPKEHRFCANGLRKIRYPAWISFAFLAVLLLDLFGGERIPFYLDGFFSLFGSFMFIQGTIFLSQILELKGVPSYQRTVLYGLAVFLGFYFVLLVGAAAPWLRRRNKTLEGVQ
jgi:hypothetical protein